MKKYLAVTLLIVFGIIIGLYWNFFISGFPVATHSILIESIRVTDNAVHISGDTANSSMAFSGYSVKFVNSTLYITPRNSQVSRYNLVGAFNIIYETKGKDIKEIYIVGKKKEDKRLIWAH